MAWRSAGRLRQGSIWTRNAGFTAHTGAVNAIAFSPDGRLLASASDDRTVRLWDPATGRTHDTLILPLSVSSVCFATPEKLTVAFGHDIAVFDHHQPARGENP